MKPRPELPPGPWLVVGAVRSGVAAARALQARGEEVVAVDAQVSLDVARQLRRPGVHRHDLAVRAQHPHGGGARPRQPHHEVGPLGEWRSHWPGIEDW